jgi:hypothetical protein
MSSFIRIVEIVRIVRIVRIVEIVMLADKLLSWWADEPISWWARLLGSLRSLKSSY